MAIQQPFDEFKWSIDQIAKTVQVGEIPTEATSEQFRAGLVQGAELQAAIHLAGAEAGPAGAARWLESATPDELRLMIFAQLCFDVCDKRRGRARMRRWVPYAPGTR